MNHTQLITVHAGAGSMSGVRQAEAKSACEEALSAGLACLARGLGAVDAVQAAVRVLEENPACNAGRGSSLTEQGGVEIDASIMDGEGLRFGGVAAMPDCGNGIDVARALMEEGRYVLLVGEGAWSFAERVGIKRRSDLIVERARLRLARDQRALGPPDPGTVGACALDRRGRLAAATSTGGTSNKPCGRVGDTPLCGGGTYADSQLGAASATGMGEGIARIVMTRHCCEQMRKTSGTDAAWQAVDTLASRVRGSGGIICLTRRGEVGIALNTEVMPFGIGRLVGAATSRWETAVDIRIDRGRDPLSLL